MNAEHTLWRNARLATCDEAMRVIERGALVTQEARIAWAGAEDAAPRALLEHVTVTHDVHGAWITPGLIDCHTHLVFAGTRAAEYAERLRGLSYEEIARRGGGIATTMRAVRAASEQELFEESAPRLASLLAEGVTSIEIKSGYGLTLADEAKMLRVARKLGKAYPATVKTTLLAAHALPPEFSGRPDDYIDTIAHEWLPALHADGLIDAVDVFCERIAFNTAQSERLFRAARDLKLAVKMHAEQLANIGGSQLAARYQALSCDHLEYTSSGDAAAMAASQTVAVLLPVAFYGLADTHKPPIDAFRAQGVPMAVATDCNPGSAPGASLLTAMSMATRLFGLTAEEALSGVTCHAARALGIHDQYGVLAENRQADFVIWNVAGIEELGYWIGYNPCRAVVRAGRVVEGSL